jgi:hypothetical protein
MYENYNNQTDHRYEIVFKPYRKEHLPNGNRMTDGEFVNAKVDVAVEQMSIRCGYA